MKTYLFAIMTLLLISYTGCTESSTPTNTEDNSTTQLLILCTILLQPAR